MGSDMYTGSLLANSEDREKEKNEYVEFMDEQELKLLKVLGEQDSLVKEIGLFKMKVSIVNDKG
jgi:hypothetical protein